MMKEQKYKSALFVIILLGFFILMAQHYFLFAKERKLKGSFTPRVQPTLTLDSWLNGEYQDEFGMYLNENIGFRNFFVRLNNQLYFSLFDYTRAIGVLVGKGNYLYEQNYIRAYFGEDFIGEAIIAEKVKKLESITKRLKKRNIDLVVVFAPGKGSYYPEYFPEKESKKEKAQTNYETYVELFNTSSVNFIDFNQWFRSLKGKTDYPLYSKTGIHWSRFGELKVADSLLKYIEALKGIELAKYEFIDTLSSKKMKFTDDDIEKGMNLMLDIEDLEMGYPSYTVLKNENTQTTRGLVVADSYYWGLFKSGFASEFLSNGQFWYYNEQIYETDKETRQVNEVDIKNEIETHNLIILLSSDVNLSRFSYGFIEQVFDLYEISDEQEKEERIQLMEKVIMHTHKWYCDIKDNAERENRKIETALRENAEYMIWMEDRIYLMKKNIIGSEEWYAAIKVKAKKDNKTIEIALRENAEYMIKLEDNKLEVSK